MSTTTQTQHRTTARRDLSITTGWIVSRCLAWSFIHMMEDDR